MRRELVLVLACSACRGLLGIEGGVVGDGGTEDVLADAPTDDDALDPPRCFGVAPYVVCVDPSIGGSETLPAQISTSTNCDVVDTSDGRDWCVIVRDSLSITGTVRAIGARPLVILSRTTLTIEATGTVDVASRQGSAMTGPAANHGTCGAGNGTPLMETGSGGAGGTFGSTGGRGGDGSPSALPGGSAQPLVGDNVLRGGCGGGRGAPGVTNVGGAGGGAIYLLAGTELQIHGRVNASGAGGEGGLQPGQGGGGGGSGGMIVLGASTLTVSNTALIFANGGGGGAGGGNNNNGGSGRDPTTVAAGGDGDTTGTGGHGGDGAAGMASGMPGRNDGAGGGGGGGGVGKLRIFATTQALSPGTFSPPPS